MLYIEHYGDSVCDAAYGPYDRRDTKWLSSALENKLIDDLEHFRTSEPLINAIMNQLKSTGYVSNRLRMVFASWCF